MDGITSGEKIKESKNQLKLYEMAMDVKGMVIQKCELQTGDSKTGGKSWQKREFVIETQEQFPKKIAFTCFGDKVSMIDTFSEGQEVTVSYNLESREYNSKWFHNINAWKIETTAKPASASSSSGVADLKANTSTQMPMPEDDGSDLPF
jgi:hypothetical protein